MLTKWLKIGVLSFAGLLIVGGFVFGKDLFSYVRTSASSIRSTVKDTVPIEFELERAKDMVEQIVPEMHANIRLIAQDEVEIAGIKEDITRSTQALTEEQRRIQKLAELIATGQKTYNLNAFHYSHQQLKEELSRRFDAYKESQDVLNGKRRLLIARENSLQTALQTLDRTKAQKTQLETQIAMLESKYNMIQTASQGSTLQMDSSKLAQTEKVIAEIRKRLDVAERVLSHEARFTQPIAVDAIDEQDLLSDVKDYFKTPKPTPTTGPTKSSAR